MVERYENDCTGGGTYFMIMLALGILMRYTESFVLSVFVWPIKLGSL